MPYSSAALIDKIRCMKLALGFVTMERYICHWKVCIEMFATLWVFLEMQPIAMLVLIPLFVSVHYYSSFFNFFNLNNRSVFYIRPFRWKIIIFCCFHAKVSVNQSLVNATLETCLNVCTCFDLSLQIEPSKHLLVYLCLHLITLMHNTIQQ